MWFKQAQLFEFEDKIPINTKEKVIAFSNHTPKTKRTN